MTVTDEPSAGPRAPSRLRGLGYALSPVWRRRRAVPQGAQMHVGEVAIAFGDREGDVAELVVHGEAVGHQVVFAPVGRVVRAGPVRVVVTRFGRDGERDVAHLAVRKT